MNKQEAIAKIKDIRNGVSNLVIADCHPADELFQSGYDYGYIAALMDAFGISKGDLNEGTKKERSVNDIISELRKAQKVSFNWSLERTLASFPAVGTLLTLEQCGELVNKANSGENITQDLPFPIDEEYFKNSGGDWSQTLKRTSEIARDRFGNIIRDKDGLPLLTKNPTEEHTTIKFPVGERHYLTVDAIVTKYDEL